jgi:hypothetical protein
MRPKISDEVVRKTDPPAKGYVIVWDGEVSGFGLRVMASGVRTAVLPGVDAAEVHESLEEVRQMMSENSVTKTGGKPNAGRRAAVKIAYWLLTYLGGERPGCTVDGPWHKLTNILYAEDRADLFPDMRKLRKHLAATYPWFGISFDPAPNFFYRPQTRR